jgi:gliding motility-associated-like protein
VSGAGNTVSGTTGTSTVAWDSTFYGQAQVCAFAQGCGGPTVPTCVTVEVTQTVGTPISPAGTIIRCMGAGTDQYLTAATAASSYNWNLSPPTAGAISPGGLVTWSPVWFGTANISVSANGCSGPSDTSSVIVITLETQPTPNVPVGTTERCQGIGADAYTASSTLATSYQWTISPPNAGTVAGSTDSVVVNWNPAFAGTASVCVVAFGCDSSNQICTNVLINPSPAEPVITANGPTTFCLGENVILSSSSPTSNSWLPNGENTAFITVTQTGVYAVVVTGTNGCTSISDDIFVNVSTGPLTPLITATDSTCAGDVITLSATPVGDFLWNTGDTTQSIEITVNSTSIFTVTITDSYGCIGTATQQVAVFDYPLATDDDSTTNHSTPITIPVTQNDNTTGSLSVILGPYNGNASVSGQQITYTPFSDFSGVDQLTYVLCLADCPTQCDTALLTIVTRASLLIPNGFSPNGDGVNDLFEIIGLDSYPNNELHILNRWGDAVYTAAPYQNTWDGTSNTGLGSGGRLTDGTYFYVFKTAPDGESFRGYVELKR